MGGCASREIEKPIVKPGVLYNSVRNTIRPFDLALFAGSDGISGLIRYLQARNLSQHKNIDVSDEEQYSHVGMIVTSEILDHPKVKEGEIYIWESTMGGRFGQNLENVDGETFLGVQLRDFDALVPAYDHPNTTSLAVCHLVSNIYDQADQQQRETIKIRFTELFERLDGTLYDLNPVSLASSLFGGLRCGRKTVQEATGTDKWLFCSELVATAYKEMGIFPSEINPENVIPMDFIGYDTDVKTEGGVPVVVQLPPIKIVSELHMSEANGEANGEATKGSTYGAVDFSS